MSWLIPGVTANQILEKIIPQLRERWVSEPIVIKEMDDGFTWVGNESPKPFYSQREAAEKLGISINTFRKRYLPGGELESRLPQSRNRKYSFEAICRELKRVTKPK
jgi:hypothetical protein